MDTNSSPSCGDCHRWHKNERNTKDTSNYMWRSSPMGRVALIIIGLTGDEKFKAGNAYNRGFKEAGVTKEYLFDRLYHFMHWFPEEYYMTRYGQQEYDNWCSCGYKPKNDWDPYACVHLSSSLLPPKTVFERYHKMYYHTGKKFESRPSDKSNEHYANSEKLRHLVEHVEPLFQANKPIEEHEAFKIGNIPNLGLLKKKQAKRRHRGKK